MSNHGCDSITICILSRLTLTLSSTESNESNSWIHHYYCSSVYKLFKYNNNHSWAQLNFFKLHVPGTLLVSSQPQHYSRSRSLSRSHSHNIHITVYNIKPVNKLLSQEQLILSTNFLLLNLVYTTVCMLMKYSSVSPLCILKVFIWMLISSWPSCMLRA